MYRTVLSVFNACHCVLLLSGKTRLNKNGGTTELDH